MSELTNKIIALFGGNKQEAEAAAKEVMAASTEQNEIAALQAQNSDMLAKMEALQAELETAKGEIASIKAELNLLSTAKTEAEQKAEAAELAKAQFLAEKSITVPEKDDTTPQGGSNVSFLDLINAKYQ